MNNLNYKDIESKVREMVEKSISILYKIDRDNIKDGVSERNLCARLALYLHEELNNSPFSNNYYVDVEYNRMGLNIKKQIQEANRNLKSIVCDLLIHSRGRNLVHNNEKICLPDNLLALEMKREPNKNNATRESDRERLKAMTKIEVGNNTIGHVANTVFGVFLEIGITCYELEFYSNGKMVDKRQIPVN